MDRLAPILARHPLQASVFFTGSLCDASAFGADGSGHVHVLRQGRLRVSQSDGESELVVGPAVLFFPRAARHALEPLDPEGVDLLCARVDWGLPAENPILAALPALIRVPLETAATTGLSPVLSLLFEEAANDHCGRQAAIDRLVEYFLILILRHLLNEGGHVAGLLAAMADPRLASAITAMHEAPERPWTVETLAEVANMSRARFAQLFRELVGQAPLDYLTEWRLRVACIMLRQGQPIKSIARSVGYESPAALTRVFSRRLGCSPRAWIHQAVAPR
jgi:AraC-like DNA-binding protein